jgi:drug/metabolite transporter (DMT)-like permease
MSVRAKALIALFCAALLWGSSGTVGKLLLREAHPFVLTFWRFFTAAIIVLPFVLGSTKPKNWIKTLLPLGLFNAGNVLFYSFGLTLTTANSGSLIGAGVPLLTVFLSWLLIHESISKEKLIGVIIGLLGAVLIILVPIIEKGYAVGTSLSGNLMMVGSALSWTMYTIRSRSLGQHTTFNPMLATFINFVTCMICALIASLITGQQLFIPAFVVPAYLSLFLFTAIAVTVVTFFLYQWALQHVPASTASLKEYAQLLCAVLINAAVLGERFTPLFWVGGSLIVMGVVIATSNRTSKLFNGLRRAHT